VRRFLSAIAFLAILVVVLGAAGCGQRFERAPGSAPTAGDLAGDALAALHDAGSAHFVADMTTKADSGDVALAPFSVHLEGDASTTALVAEGTVGIGGATLSGSVQVGEHSFFVEFMGRWYGDRLEGIADAVAEAKREHDGQIWEELATPDGLRRNFGKLFDGEVAEGPVVDGVATWQFEGRFDAEGMIEFTRRYDAEPTDEELEEFRLVAEGSRLLLVVGQDDRLPRRLELSMELSDEALEELSEGLGTPDSFRATLALSEFGKRVELHEPEDFRPFDQLFENLFGGFE
jgi:hypothetical protein